MFGVLSAALLLAGCSSEPEEPAPKAKVFTADQRADGDHCLGDFVPHSDDLRQAVMLDLPNGQMNVSNDRTSTRGGGKLGREVVMEFAYQPSGIKGAAIGDIDVSTCRVSNIRVRAAKSLDAGYPIE